MKHEQIQKYEEADVILFYQGRINPENQLRTQDLDGCKFLDFMEIGQLVPVVLEDSPVLYSYIMWIHYKINPHAEVEATVKDVCKKMRVPKGLRKLVKRITLDCVKCKIKTKKVSEVKMSTHNEARTVLAPPFQASMADIAYGFKGKPFRGARMELKVYAIVIICLLSGACNILSMEGCETQNVVAGIERHAARYGVPGYIYIDNGTQLKALKHSSMSLRDVHAQVQDSLGIQVVVFTVKAHWERGQVDRKIRSLRESLEKMGVNTNHPQTVLQQETLFAKIANTVDNLPMAKGDTSNSSNLGYEIITPNRLKLGRNNYPSLEGSGIKLEMASKLIALLERNQELYCEWFGIFIENIHMLDLRPNKWLKNSRLPVLEDVVVFVFNDTEYGKGGMDWRLGKITGVKETQKTGKDYRSERNSNICYILR